MPLINVMPHVAPCERLLPAVRNVMLYNIFANLTAVLMAMGIRDHCRSVLVHIVFHASLLRKTFML
jgi:N-acyl-L-homoserine lactone synthetase